MVVYQALERINGSVDVAAVLDAAEWLEQRREYGYETSSDDDDDPGSKCYLSRRLWTTVIGEEVEEGDYQWSPEELDFPYTKVTWLNDGPQSFNELAALYIAVSRCIRFPGALLTC
jgi:hypothetical protein